MLMHLPSHLASVPHVLIFSHISERDGAAILRELATTLREHNILIHHLILSTYKERLDGLEDIGTMRPWFLLDLAVRLT